MTVAMWFKWDVAMASGSWGFTHPWLMYSDKTDASGISMRPMIYFSGTTYAALYWYLYTYESSTYHPYAYIYNALDDALAGSWTHMVTTMESNIDFVRDLPDTVQNSFTDVDSENWVTKIYINGEIVLEDDSTLPMYGTRDSMILGNDKELGYNAFYPRYPFYGSILSFQIWSRALGEDEVATLYSTNGCFSMYGHLCVAGGTVFSHPTASPTVTPLPSAPPTPSPSSAPTTAPSPAPSISCPTARPIYRLNLADWGGDGWQGASYRVYNASDYPNIAMSPSSMMANGTLASGPSGVDWLCLADGCYEIVVDGGAADSEIGFEFADEVGGHFRDFTAPYADHMCVADGEVFAHPTASPTTSPPSPFPTYAPTALPTASLTMQPTALPTASPTMQPTALPTALLTMQPTALPTAQPTLVGCTNNVLDTSIGETDVDCGGDSCPPCALGSACSIDSDCFGGGSCVSSVCTYTPTAIPTSAPSQIPAPAPTQTPIPAPTQTPTPAPTRTPMVGTSVGISGLVCADFDASIYVTALDKLLANSTFGDATCTDATGSSVSIYCEVNTPRVVYLAASHGSLLSYVSFELNASVHSGAFTTEIQALAARRRLEAAEQPRRRMSMASATVDSVVAVTFSPSPAPTGDPTAAPTPAPTLAPTDAPTLAPVQAPTAAPTPAPSTSCPTARPIYRLNLADSGGDGWQGASYRVYNATDYPNITMSPSTMVANGTLASGSSGIERLCLADGCYEIVVGGGDADSEIGFEFVDENASHFSDLTAPYADHMCVAGGHVFAHPTSSPTTPPPTAPPSTRPTVVPTAELPVPAATASSATSADSGGDLMPFIIIGAVICVGGCVGIAAVIRRGRQKPAAQPAQSVPAEALAHAILMDARAVSTVSVASVQMVDMSMTGTESEATGIDAVDETPRDEPERADASGIAHEQAVVRRQPELPPFLDMRDGFLCCEQSEDELPIRH